YLPLGYGTIKTREYAEERKTYTEEEAIAIANSRLIRYLDCLIQNDVLVTDNNVEIKIENNTCIAQGRILVEEPAWEYKTIQENEWRIEQTDEHNGDNN
ncbi:MAG: sporulation protein YqfD, partial [Herbinix sp.]|nr:sporulation protein YqfD [Herbinix sp.]